MTTIYRTAETSLSRRLRTSIRRAALRGMTITELMLTLAVGAVILTGVVTLYGKSTASAKETQAVQQVAQIVKSVRQLYANDGAYGSSGGSALNASLINSRSLPDGMINTGASTIRHAFGGNINVTGYANTFTIAMAEYPQDGCSKTITSLLGTGDLVSVQIGSGSQRQPPMTADQVIADCSAQSSGTLTLTYR